MKCQEAMGDESPGLFVKRRAFSAMLSVGGVSFVRSAIFYKETWFSVVVNNIEISTTRHSKPAKSLKGNTGGGSFCGIGITYAMPFSQKCTPPHCFFCNFACWE